MSKTRILVSLDQDTLDIINKIKGLGSKKAERIHNIVMSWLNEKSYIKDYNKK